MLNRIVTRLKGVDPIQTPITNKLFHLSMDDRQKGADFSNMYLMARLSQSLAYMKTNEMNELLVKMGFNQKDLALFEGKNGVRALCIDTSQEKIVAMAQPGIITAVKANMSNDQFFVSTSKRKVPNHEMHQQLIDFNRYCNLTERFYQSKDKRVWLTGHGIGGSLASLAFTRQPSLLADENPNAASYLVTFDPYRFGNFSLLNDMDRKFANRIFQFLNGHYSHLLSEDNYPLYTSEKLMQRYVQTIAEIIAKKAGIVPPPIVDDAGVPMPLLTYQAIERERFEKEVIETADGVICEQNKEMLRPQIRVSSL